MSTEERFWEKTRLDPTTGCLLWTRAVSRTGYGRFNLNNKNRIAHRVAWTLRVGPIPDGTCVLHRCDVRNCVNPDHLFLGTHTDNMADMMAKGRGSSNAGMENGSAFVTPAVAREILSMPGAPVARLTKRFKVSHYTIWRIRSGKHWTASGSRAVTP